MAAALATRCRIKQKRRWVRRPTSGRTVYAYVLGNPVNYIDPEGLQAYSLFLNSRSTNDSVSHIRPASEGTIVMAPLRGAAMVSAGFQAGILGAMVAPVAGGEAMAVCKNEKVKEAARDVCMAVGVCAYKGPHDPPETQYYDDRQRIQQIWEGSRIEAGEVGRIIFPAGR